MSDSTSRTPSVAEASPAHLEIGNSGLSNKPADAHRSTPIVDRTVIAQSPIAGPGEFYPTGTVASLAKVLIGQQLDHFQLHELVGGGGMGAVFRASDTRLDRVVAVKVIPNLGRDLETLRRFRFEAQSAARLDHPHIARVYYVGETEAWSYIVFEFVEGVNLRDLVIRHGPLSVDEAVCYTCQVAEALQHASERSVVHRDIKPSNVLVTPDGIIKVVDMGLARTTSLDRSANDLTASGVTLGTFDYISPEQARDPRAADVRSDLYSLGCTLYYMLTGRPPYPDGTVMQKLLMHGTVQAADPRDFRDDVSPDLSAIIRKLMAKKPTDRYQQPIDLVADLQCLANLESLTKSQQAVGLLVAPVASDRTLFEIAMPWAVGILVVLGTTWYLHAQHIATASFIIPPEVVPTQHSIQEPSILELDNGKRSPFDKTPFSTEAFLGTEKPYDLLSSETSGTRASNGYILSPDFRSPLSISDPEAANSQGLFSSGRPQNSKSVSPGEGRTKPNTRVLWVRPFESTEPVIEQGLEYQVVTGNLAEAMALANAETEIEEIWLDDDVWTIDTTLELKRESLAIRSAPDRKARIEVRIPRNIMATLDGKTVGIDVGSNRIELDNLDLFMVSPDSGAGSSCLLGLSRGGSVQVMRSTITLASTGSTWKASGIGAKPEKLSPTSDASRSVQEPIKIDLEDVVFRGEGDLVALDSAQRTEFKWSNGLLAVSGRMFELGGARDPSRTPPTIRIDLQQVTVAARQGFARIRFSKDHSYPVCLSRESKNCAYTNDSNYPLVAFENVDFDGEEPLSEILPMWLDLRGRDNAYDEQINTLIKWSSIHGEVSRIGFEATSPDYFSERAREASVLWVKPRPIQKPFEQQSADDYLQREGSFRPGFRPELLPNH